MNDVKLTDKYTINQGRVLISGTQALAKLPTLQKLLDEKAGLNTAGFISGYRGSPLGGFDALLYQNQELLDKYNIVFQPGVNEDLAATAIWGTQQLDNFAEEVTVDGVFSMWYGKGPGIDRSGDVLKHANFSGTNKNGGVLVVAGDDHPGKSSTVPNQSELVLMACSIPVIYPSNVEEFFEFGLFGWALSRYSGLWVGFKSINETVEQTATVNIDIEKFSFTIPDDAPTPVRSIHFKPRTYTPILDEVDIARVKLPMAQAFASANKIDKTPLLAGNKKFGVVTAGKSYMDVMRALELLNLSRENAETLGISIYKVGMIYPLEPQGFAAFAEGHQQLFFVEEKKAVMEGQATRILFNLAERPTIVGKQDLQGNQLLPGDVQLEPMSLALTLVDRFAELGMLTDEIEQRSRELQALSGQVSQVNPATARSPYFCSGCPHNRSTKLPEGSKGGSGIGCHAMALFTNPNIFSSTHMGGEGATWYGLSQFTNAKHIFQNLGDGTYFHSGYLAIRGAVAAGINITYKILYNDAIAMTGGQPLDAPMSVGNIARQLLAEGVKKVVLVTDKPGLHKASGDIPANVEIKHRELLPKVQLEFREIPGTTVIIYEQVCAAEKRRRRKRGLMEDIKKRSFINEAVCEGCGDCSVQSNCVSIIPEETELGRKRAIDQSSCNKDFTCQEGLCPSFVTVYGGDVSIGKGVVTDPGLFANIPTPEARKLSQAYNVMITGIGGTGVITIGAILSMAAHMEGRAASVYDMTGLAQKGGGVYSHLKIAEIDSDINTQRIGQGEADLVIACDLLASTGQDAISSIRQNHTKVFANSNVAMSIAFQFMPDIKPNDKLAEQQIKSACGEENYQAIAGTSLAEKLLANTIATNMMMVGYAFQQGSIPVSSEAIEKAIALNGVAVQFNKTGFALGRLIAHDSKKVASILKESGVVINTFTPLDTVEEIKQHRVALLTDYQDGAYAQRFINLVDKVTAVDPDENSEFTKVVARGYARLMAYKDEYEVARLYTNGDFAKKLGAQFEGDIKVSFNLAPPLFGKRDPVTGHLKTKQYGSWMMSAFTMLARFKGLRGTAFDIFGYTKERKLERELINEYQQLIMQILPKLAGKDLSAEQYNTAVELASTAQQLRGFGHVKEANVAQVKQLWQKLQHQFNSPEAVLSKQVV